MTTQKNKCVYLSKKGSGAQRASLREDIQNIYEMLHKCNKNVT